MDTHLMGIEFFKSTAFCSKYCPFCGFTSISQFKSHSSDHRVLTDSKSDKNLDHLEDCWARDQILEKKWIHIWYGSVTFISIPIALSVVYLYCLNEGLRFTMLCSYGVWRAVINLTNFQNDCDICEKYFT